MGHCIKIHFNIFSQHCNSFNHIGSVMVSMLSDSVVDCEFKLKPRSSQTKDYEIGIYYFSPKHATLRAKTG